MKNLIKEWYMETYPTDELGREITDEFTFDDLKEFLDYEHKLLDIYDLIGVADSLVRERIMVQVTKLYNMTYDEVYDKAWKNPDEMRVEKYATTWRASYPETGYKQKGIWLGTKEEAIAWLLENNPTRRESEIRII